MQTAPIARCWRKAKLMWAYQVHATNLGSRDAAMVMFVRRLGLPTAVPDHLDEAAELMTSDEARNLAQPQLYVVTPQMCDVVIAGPSRT